MKMKDIPYEWTHQVAGAIDWSKETLGFTRPALIGSLDPEFRRVQPNLTFDYHLPIRFNGRASVQLKRWYDDKLIRVIYFSFGVGQENGVYIVDESDLKLIRLDAWERLLKDF